MPRQRWIPETGEWVDIDAAPVRNVPQSAPFVIPDEMDGTVHPVTGEVMTSKRAFSRTTRAAGCYEMGNEKPTLNKHNQRPENIKERKREIRESLEFAASLEGKSNSEKRERIEAFKARR